MIWVFLLGMLSIIPPLVPDQTLTPGVILTSNTNRVCTPGYAEKTRNVTLATKLAVYKSYGLEPSGKWRQLNGVRIWQSDFEVDHLISLQLGGSNDPLNLWPQSYLTPEFNATAKDRLENRLHWLVCHNRMRLADAQRMIRTDWIGAYRIYILESSNP